jgi:hypothetical protein
MDGGVGSPMETRQRRIAATEASDGQRRQEEHFTNSKAQSSFPPRVVRRVDHFGSQQASVFFFEKKNQKTFLR